MTEVETGRASSAPATDDELDLLDVMIAIAKHKALVLGAPLIVAGLVALATFMMPNIYTATARILPPQQTPSMAAAVLNQLGGALAETPGVTWGIKNPNDIYVGMLKSRTVADHLIERFKLRRLYHKKTLVATREVLERTTNIIAGRDGLITISVDDENPGRAAALANAYVDELDTLNNSLAITGASQRRLFFEKQLKQAKDELASAETAFTKIQERTGIIKLDAQGNAIIDAVAKLKAQIAAKEVQITSMRSFAAAKNPDLSRTELELSGLRKQLRKLEASHSTTDGDVMVPTSRVPQLRLEYIRQARNVKYHEALFELLAKQYEIARLDESRNVSLIQVLDRAVPPDRRSKPKRLLITLVAGTVTGLISILWALLVEFTQRVRRNPHQAPRLEILLGHLLRRTK